MNWYYAANNQQYGPLTEGEFAQLVLEGKITPQTLVWREGMDQWQPYGEVAPSPATAVPPLPPGATSVSAGGIVSGERDGPPWENRGNLGLFGAVLETIKGVLFDPAVAFARMRREGGLAAPLQYMLVAGSVGSYVGVVYNLISQQARGIATAPGGVERIHFTAAIAGFVLIAALFLVPLALTIGSFINAGITHLCLMLVGGAKQPFETTFRVICYSHGSVAIFQIVPVCGAFICGIWALVVTCIGLSKAHEISTGKAVFAVVLPVICCCGVFVAIFAAIYGYNLQGH